MSVRRFVGVVLIPHKVDFTFSNAHSHAQVSDQAKRYVGQLGTVDGYDSKLLQLMEVPADSPEPEPEPPLAA